MEFVRIKWKTAQPQYNLSTLVEVHSFVVGFLTFLVCL